MHRLTGDFFLHDSLEIAQALIGKVLVSEVNGQLTSGRIVETEAYLAPADKGSHAYKGKRTARTATMYLPGGHVYIYLCYGLHHLFNIVVGEEEVPHAILIRALEPLEGVDIMQERRQQKAAVRLCAGPGMLTQAMGISSSLDATNITKDNSPVYIIDDGNAYSAKEIMGSPRVGIAYAGAWAYKDWRFRVKDSPHTSKPRVVNY